MPSFLLPMFFTAKQFFFFTYAFLGWLFSLQATSQKPNIIVIYLDDLGYGDVSAYQPDPAKAVLKTPHMDRLVESGLKFTQGFSSSATCTPSRFALLTGTYPWRQSNVKILPGSAPLVIDPKEQTLPKVLQSVGYRTAVIGKWHLGLGNPDASIDWNGSIKPGPVEIGFQKSFILAATQDRVPTVYIEQDRVLGLDPMDPLFVSYEQNFQGEPTALSNPELLRLKWHHGHNQSVIHGIPRIGYSKGGKSAHWNDETMADVFIDRVKRYLTNAKRVDAPFFLFYALHQPHVPRTPHPRFVGKSGLGPRGDAILEADWCIGELLKTLEAESLMEETLLIFSSDNGPVLNDGYQDNAVELKGHHEPAGPLRGGKYSLYEAGTRVAFSVTWKGTIQPGTSAALVGQIDLLASLASLTGASFDAKDSQNLLPAFLGQSSKGRDALILEANSRTALRTENWALIPPYPGRPIKNKNVGIELGNDEGYQLYDLSTDIGQKNNVAKTHPEQLKTLIKRYEALVPVQYRKSRNH